MDFSSIYCRVYWLHMTSKHMRGEKNRSSTLATTVTHSALLGKVTLSFPVKL